MLGSWKNWKIVGLGIVFGGLGTVALVFAQEYGKASEQERGLVEQVYNARQAYQASLERILSYYVQRNNVENQQWLEKELVGYHLNVKHPFILEMGLPSKSLRPDVSIPKANRIFREALRWLNATAWDREENYHRSELLFQRLIHDYPQSDKLDEACYYLGEIYASKYFYQYRRSVTYFERVFYYEPNTNLDARLRAAQNYEEYLDNHQRAIELYQEVLRREIDPQQTREANRRLENLLKRRKPALR